MGMQFREFAKQHPLLIKWNRLIAMFKRNRLIVSSA